MINILKNIEKTVLLDLLKQPEVWKSLDINYHPPRVERLYTFWNGYRICLHKIFSCKKEEALYHPHPWSAAFHILDGSYETGIGYSETEEIPKVLSTIKCKGDMYYEMRDSNTWHYVRPTNNNDWCYSIMVNGEHYDDINPVVKSPDVKLKELSEEKKASLLRSFQVLYEIN